MTQWTALPFDELTSRQVYAILQLRSEVFVIEQNCVYEDIDGVDLDAGTLHVLGYNDNNELVAYGRVYGHLRHAGRIVTRKSARGAGLGRELVSELIKNSQRPLQIAAQSYLLKFYGSFGFKPMGAEYLEDDIPHTDMVLAD